MRYEIKHDKLAAQVFNKASSEAKARRKAASIYQMYEEIGANRRFNKEDLEYIARFQSVLGPSKQLLALIDESKKELGRAQREAEEQERIRLKREQELIEKGKMRQRNTWLVIFFALGLVVLLLIYAVQQSNKAKSGQKVIENAKVELEKKSTLAKHLMQITRIEQEDSIRKKAPKLLKDGLAFMDPRDMKIYGIVEMNGKAWMTENLDYDAGEGCWVYKGEPDKEEGYGRLYNWESAKKACPPNWRLPSDEEWFELMKQFEEESILTLFDKGPKDSFNPKAAYEALIKSDSSRFNVRLAGFRNDSKGSFERQGDWGGFWSSTENNQNPALAWYYVFRSREVSRGVIDKNYGISCRCLKDIGD
ncbi:MAG: FISUMP domain-containing protein [Saprospiraceae bacterium]|nr:hypothetical protein [Lewinella sp.]